ncbi:hypothetical protein B0H14DRAFT_3469767 [Mycena olivaceomarginata]|nr:hypothetical protein B0H14DRAFT_3469767 [Mycena olivaceomarginata]
MSAISRPQQDDLMLSGYRASPALPDDRREALHWLYQSGVPVNVRSSTGPGRPVVYNPHPDLKPHILYKHKASVNAPGTLNDEVNEDHKLIAAAVPPAMTSAPDASQAF